MAGYPLGEWSEMQRLVLRELQDLHTIHDRLEEKVDEINATLTNLRIKVAGVSAAAGIITGIVVNYLTELL